METIKKLPVYKLKVSKDDTSPLIMDYIGLVDDPAIQLNWLTFNNKTRFAANTERRLLMGPLMIADMPIYRRDEEHGEYYVIFDKEEIYKINEKFFRHKLISNFNIMHGEGLKTEGVYMVGCFFTDKAMGINPPDAFKDVSEGSLFIVVKVDDDVLWDEFIKTGHLKGFSIEGLFAYEKVSDTPQSELDEIVGMITGG